jgi:hypothetical protein
MGSSVNGASRNRMQRTAPSAHSEHTAIRTMDAYHHSEKSAPDIEIGQIQRFAQGEQTSCE